MRAEIRGNHSDFPWSNGEYSFVVQRHIKNMASSLVEKARKIGGDDLAEQVEQIEREIANVADLDQTLIEDVGLSEVAVAGMTPQAKREVAEMEKTNVVDIPIAGGSPEKTNSDGCYSGIS